MLPLLKKPNEKAAASLMPAWHPNFRNAELLPDVKAVRTAFFVNGAAILVVMVLSLYLIQSELGLRSLREQTANAQQQINTEKPGSDKALVQFQKFQDEEKTLLELKQFQVGKIVGSELLLELGESLPPRITLTMVDYNGPNIVLRGSIAGSPDEASGDASAYLSILGNQPAFKEKFDGISLTGITRNPTTSGISFEILLKLKSDQKGVKK
ncbi:MAG: hypothetical protein WC661_14975 [Opitutaceae bacterium]